MKRDRCFTTSSSTRREEARIDKWAAGKTGTTQSYRDAWFVGWSDDLATAVSVGLSPSAGADDQGARHQGDRRQLPCTDLGVAR